MRFQPTGHQVGAVSPSPLNAPNSVLLEALSQLVGEGVPFGLREVVPLPLVDQGQEVEDHVVPVVTVKFTPNVSFT